MGQPQVQDKTHTNVYTICTVRKVSSRHRYKCSNVHQLASYWFSRMAPGLRWMPRSGLPHWLVSQKRTVCHVRTWWLSEGWQNSGGKRKRKWKKGNGKRKSGKNFTGGLDWHPKMCRTEGSKLKVERPIPHEVVNRGAKRGKFFSLTLLGSSVLHSAGK